MRLGMVGLGRMGASMVRRLIQAGHECVVYDIHGDAVKAVEEVGAIGAASLVALVDQLVPPRAVWMMVPAAVVEATLHALGERLAPGDILIDGGNSYYKDDIARAKSLKNKGIHFVDVGTSGGVWGEKRGYCLMIGGEAKPVAHLEPLFATLAPGAGEVPRTAGRTGAERPAEKGYLHCGPNGAGHFVKMVHNGIEYGIMAAYAEGFNILKHANAGQRSRAVDAETTPLRNPEDYPYEIDVAGVAEVWRRGSVIASWLLDLAAIALERDASLNRFSGRVSDSGEGRWTTIAALEEGVPAHVLSAALFNRFTSQGEADFGDQLLSALRYEFGGHEEKPASR
jgi:6-phosphogluconate dehydrogenase